MKIMNQFNKYTEKFIDIVTIVFFVLLLVLLIVNVFFRLVPIYNLSWFDEIVEFSFAWLVFFGAASLWYKKEHSRVDFIPEKYKGRVSGDVLNLTNEILSVIFAIVFTYFGYLLFRRVTAFSPILQIPRKYFYLSMPMSGVLMIIYSISHIIGYINVLKLQFKAKRNHTI